MTITEDEIEALFTDENINPKWEGDNAMQGLLILQKFHRGTLLCGANHDIIYSIEVSEAVKGGMTKEDAYALRMLNWGTEDGYFYCFV